MKRNLFNELKESFKALTERKLKGTHGTYKLHNS